MQIKIIEINDEIQNDLKNEEIVQDVMIDATRRRDRTKLDCKLQSKS